MSKSNSKSRIIQIYKLLLEETDEEHFITVREIIERLEEQGITAYRKTVIADIEELKSQGADIVGIRSSQNKYYLRQSRFSLTELKLLADAVSCSHFITTAKSAEIVEKLSSLTSRYNREQLGCHIYLSERLKSDNEEIYNVVDIVNIAVNQKHRISFLYFEYDAKKNKVYRNGGARYELSPYGMTWDDGNYYVIGYSLKHKTVISLRADRMADVQMLEAVSYPEPDGFNISDFVNTNFHMFGGGKVIKVQIRCKNELMKSIIDRFGIDVKITPSVSGWFNAFVDVAPSPTFFAWVFQFRGGVKIVKPFNVKRTFFEMMNEFRAGEVFTE